MFKRLGFIVNPAAGRGRSKDMMERLVSMLRRRRVEFSIDTSEGPGHAMHLARELSKKTGVIIAVGGDGTANEVANGVVGSKSAFGIVPVGSGNDFAFALGMPRRLEDSLEVILKGHMKKVDVGKLRFGKGRSSTARYFLNTVGVGFDAAVAYESGKIKWLRGIPLYLVGICKVLAKFQPLEFRVRLDGAELLQETCFLVCVGNGDREGGGFRITPDARIDDGKLDVCMIRKTPLRNAVRIVRAVLKGEHVKLPEVVYRQAKSIMLSAVRSFQVHADGEVMAQEQTEVRLDVIPGALKAIFAV